MDFYTAMLVPGVLTLVVLVLSWVYLKNAARLASDNLTKEISSSIKQEKDEKLIDEQQLANIQKNEDNSTNEDNLRAELEPYMIKASDIQDDVPVPLDNDLIQHEMKEKGMENIQMYYKTSKLQIKQMEEMLTRQEKEQEREAQRKQLEEIFKLMAKEKEKFGVDSMDQVEDQMKLYLQ